MPAPRVLCLVLSLILGLAACGRDDSLAGRYQALAQNGGKRPAPVVLTLKPDGKATLAMEGEDAALRWGRGQGGQVWLHTRDGGVVTAQVLGNDLEMTLPGAEKLRFKRVVGP